MLYIDIYIFISNFLDYQFERFMNKIWNNFVLKFYKNKYKTLGINIFTYQIIGTGLKVILYHSKNNKYLLKCWINYNYTMQCNIISQGFNLNSFIILI